MKKKSKKLSEYELQALDFLARTKSEIAIQFSHTGKHFEENDTFRDIYNISIQNKKHKFEFTFGQCIRCSGTHKIYIRSTPNYTQHEIGFFHQNGNFFSKNYPTKNYGLQKSSEEIFTGHKLYEKCIKIPLSKNDEYGIFAKKNPHFSKPSEYDILACLTKCNPESLENFCSEFGYDTDSMKANKIYLAVQNEWSNIRKLWTPEEIEILGEIQ